MGYMPIGVDSRELPLPMLGDLSELEEVVQNYAIENIIVAAKEYSPETHHAILAVLQEANRLHVPVTMYSDVFNFASQECELDEFSGFFVIPPTSHGARWKLQRLLKRGMDLAIGIVGSVITVLAFPVLGLIIFLDDPGPILYRQSFVKERGKRGHYWKFRTMRVDAEDILERDPQLRAEYERKFKLENDPRVTRVGRYLRKFSIDEFPEFFSVLVGTLSFVGPRTISEREVPKYGDQLEKLLSVKPGVTGFWQVMGRQLTSYEERVKMDMFYIDRWSIWVDIYIVLKTFSKVITGEGAH
jgi:lipopolysaccharide/colanic/teichoic acid biosynthesis glycosyltransferase